MQAHQLDGFLIPHNDTYFGEYLTPCDERLAWVTGFTGSAGFCIVLKDKAAVFVDGRYTIQSKIQVNQDIFQLETLGEEKKWLKENSNQEDIIGYDPNLFSEGMLNRFKSVHENLKAVPYFIDQLWENRPSHPQTKLFAHSIEYAGKTFEDKLASIRSQMRDADVDLTILPPESWSWLLNVRGSDLAYTPISQGFCAVGADFIKLFLHQTQQDFSLTGVTYHSVSQIHEELKKLSHLTLGYDHQTTPLSLVEVFPKVKAFSDPCTLPRAIKNPVELKGATQAHTKDAIAWISFWKKFDDRLDKGEKLYELDVAEMLFTERRKQPGFHSLSFATIAGAGEHGAIVHYKPESETNREIKQNELLLIDSGAQYLDGTTDITRVLAIGTPTKEMIGSYTQVLKGHIAIATAKFPSGTTGAQLDALARYPLWQHFKDFAHGTGHGVGSFLSVHEGPQRISRLGHHPLSPGMILSNEPGYYQEGDFGIRIENLIYVRELQEGWYGFENLTLVPLERKLIDFTALTEFERDWVAQYHDKIIQMLTPHLDKELQSWLEQKC